MDGGVWQIFAEVIAKSMWLVATTSLKWPPSKVSSSNNSIRWPEVLRKRLRSLGCWHPLCLPLNSISCWQVQYVWNSAISAMDKNGSVRLPDGWSHLVLPLLLARVLLRWYTSVSEFLPSPVRARMSGCLVADVVSYYTVSATGKGKGIAKVNPTISYARARMSSCLVADVISYCLCCWLKPLMENCYVEDMSWREWQVKIRVIKVKYYLPISFEHFLGFWGYSAETITISTIVEPVSPFRKQKNVNEKSRKLKRVIATLLWRPAA